MDCFLWIVLLYNPISGLQRFLCRAIMSIAMVQKGLSQMVAGDQLCNKPRGGGGVVLGKGKGLGRGGGWWCLEKGKSFGRRGGAGALKQSN